MLRRVIVAATLLATAVVALPSSSATTTSWPAVATQAIWHQLGDPSFPAPPVPTPTNRASGWAPQAPGTTQTLDLDFGPYVVTAGSDLSRLDFAPAAAT